MVALLLDVTASTLISLTSPATCAVYSVTLPLKAGESAPGEILSEDRELSPDLTELASAPSSSGDVSAPPVTLIWVPAAVKAAPSAFTYASPDAIALNFMLTSDPAAVILPLPYPASESELLIYSNSEVS